MKYQVLIILALTASFTSAYPGDLNNDNVVNLLDILYVQGAFETPGNATTDLNSDGIVNVFDLVQVAKLFGTTYGDVNPPVLSLGAPSGIRSVFSSNVTITLVTNENALCKLATTAGTDYALMPVSMSTSNGTGHTYFQSGLTNGTSYTYYARCVDSSNNSNTIDYTITFRNGPVCGDNVCSSSETFVVCPADCASPAGTFKEPPGFTPVANRAMNVKANLTNGGRNNAELCGLAAPCPPGKTWDDVERIYSNIYVVNDASGPLSPENVMRFYYPAQTVPNSNSYSPGQLTMFTTGTMINGSNVNTRIYFRFAFRVSENWYGHNSLTNKILFVRSQPWNGFTDYEPIVRLRGSGNNPLVLNIGWQGMPETDVSLSPNGLGDLTVANNVTKGVWHTFECIMTVGEVNTESGSAECWLDGEHTHRAYDINYRDNPNGWGGLHFDPVYGGGGGTIPADQYWDLDHAYMSVAP
jgi:hypothetical protein